MFRPLLCILVLFLLAASAERSDYIPPASQRGWPQWGRDFWNSHFQPSERKLTVANVGQLQARCSFDISSYGLFGQPTTTGDSYLYFTAATGILYAVDRFDCSVIWQYNVTQFLVSNQSVIHPLTPYLVRLDSRSSPAIYREFIYIATRGGAYLLKINRFTGTKVWHVKVDDHPFAMITASPVVDHRGRVLVGVSSLEEVAALFLAGPPVNYRCCTFQGSMNAFSATDGTRLWRTSMLPPNGGVLGGYAGAAVWGSAPSIDTTSDYAYIATGNLYRAPDTVEQCRNLTDESTVVNAHGVNFTIAQFEQRDPCRLQSIAGHCGDCSESIVSIRLSDGWVDWSSPKGDVDSYNVACGLQAEGLNLPRSTYLCPQTPGPDYDFGQAPSFVPQQSNSPGRNAAVFVGQKSGIIWANNARSGQDLWSSAVSPGGPTGGLQWGIATDGDRYYFTADNSDRLNYTINFQGINMTINYASFGAVNITNGAILWQTPSPSQGTGQSTLAIGNGIIFAGGRDGVGAVHALDAATGSVLWTATNGKNSVMAVTLPGDGSVITVGGYASFSDPTVTGRLVIYTLPNFSRRDMDND